LFSAPNLNYRQDNRTPPGVSPSLVILSS
jgi:hypothetical protein